MAKAGAYSALVTTNAPAKGAVTDKARGYQWLEYGLPAPPVDTPNQDRVIYWWEFEEGSAGGFVPLLPENPIDSYFKMLNGYVSTTGVDRQGADLEDASLRYGNMEDQIAALDLADQVWSCSFWYKTHTTLAGEGGRYIVDAWNADGSAVPGERKWRFTLNATANGFIFSIGQGPTINDFTDIDTGDISLAPSTWYHMVATHDPVADEMTFTVSLRGGSVGTRLTTAISGGAFVGAVPNFSIDLGRQPPLSCNGVVDMLAFWDTSAILTEAEVEDLFTNETNFSELANPVIPTNIVIDNFVDVNGTPIASHTPDLDAGSGWILDAGALTIQSNALLPSNLAVFDVCRIDAGISDAIVSCNMKTAYVDDANHGANRLFIHVDAARTGGYECIISPGFTSDHFKLRDINGAVNIGSLTIPEIQNLDDIDYTVEVFVRDNILVASLIVGSKKYNISTVGATNSTTDTTYGLGQTGVGTYTMRAFDQFLITTIS